MAKLDWHQDKMMSSVTLDSAVALDPHARNAVRADDRRILIVGASGWIGRVLLAGLYAALGADQFFARVACFGSRMRRIKIGGGVEVEQRPLLDLRQLQTRPTMMFHLAFLTKDKVAGMARDDYVAMNRALSTQIRQCLDEVGVDRLFVASSGAAALAEDNDAAEDLRIYGQLKAEDELLFSTWARNKDDRRVVITRIYSVSGPFINKHETYALASFILDSLAGRDIKVRAPYEVVRSYVAIRELVSLALMQLLAANGPQTLLF
ncbi:NAD-dependent epimerase/dehydratase family protein, partial [Erythrobacter sp.]|uniref:NAD-dependent epimerase/dehydratase family protein n=1 Tax=Erythrobacter sp. TaxID=1042 RepID=UPI00311D54C8